MRRVRVRTTFFLSFMIAMMVVIPAFGSQEKVVARGDGIVVTEADVKAMQGMVKENFKPTRKALVDGTVRCILFAGEALREGISCPPAAEAEGFAHTLRLADCYFRDRLAAMELKDGAVESFYRVNWKRFTINKDGDPHELDDNLRTIIRERILTAKRKIFIKQEFNRLCLKFNVVFAENGS